MTHSLSTCTIFPPKAVWCCCIAAPLIQVDASACRLAQAPIWMSTCDHARSQVCPWQLAPHLPQQRPALSCGLCNTQQPGAASVCSQPAECARLAPMHCRLSRHLRSIPARQSERVAVCALDPLDLARLAWKDADKAVALDAASTEAHLVKVKFQLELHRGSLSRRYFAPKRAPAEVTWTGLVAGQPWVRLLCRQTWGRQCTLCQGELGALGAAPPHAQRLEGRPLQSCFAADGRHSAGKPRAGFGKAAVLESMHTWST